MDLLRGPALCTSRPGFDLIAIASIGSAVALLVFTLISAAHRGRTKIRVAMMIEKLFRMDANANTFRPRGDGISQFGFRNCSRVELWL